MDSRTKKAPWTFTKADSFGRSHTERGRSSTFLCRFKRADGKIFAVAIFLDVSARRRNKIFCLQHPSTALLDVGKIENFLRGVIRLTRKN